MRFALAIIAALANAAGPWLCCCAMAALVGSPALATAATPVPVKQSAPKCSHCVEVAVPDSPAKPPKPAPAKPCPCQERQVVNPTTVQPATETAATADAIALDFHAIAGTVEVLAAVAPSVAPVAGWPFLTAETRLHVHHVLRC